MEVKLLLASVLLLLVFTHDIQGLPGNHGQSLTVRSNTEDSLDDNVLTTSSPVTVRRHLRRHCNCKGSRNEMVKPRCLCKQLTVDNGSGTKGKRLQRCRMDKHNKKKCARILKQNTVLPQPIPI
ncbi:uncharacterized protein LOC144984590 [Oryzias latipes]